MKDWIIKAILLSGIVMACYEASKYKEKQQELAHQKYLYCVEHFNINKFSCAMWAQFDTDWK